MLLDQPSSTEVNNGHKGHKDTIFDVTGRRVRELVREPQKAGSYEVIWDGTSERGHQVATGVYFYRMAAGENTFVRKMILAR